MTDIHSQGWLQCLQIVFPAISVMSISALVVFFKLMLIPAQPSASRLVMASTP